MPTAEKNKAALEGLIAKANAATGGADTTVTDAVDTLIAGFGQGGGEEARKGLFYLTDYVDGYPTTLIYNCPDTKTMPSIFTQNVNFNGQLLQFIKRVVMPDTVTTIGEQSFMACGSLEELSNWESITYVDSEAFNVGKPFRGTNKRLQYTEFPPNLTYINNAGFMYNLPVIRGQIPDSVTHIGDNAFVYGGNSNWEITKLPPNLTYIGKMAFHCYRKLLITEIPATVDHIGDNAFNGIYDKTSLTILKFRGVPTTISGNAFLNNTALANIYVPWAEGAVANAPWGATNATIHYNTVYDADGKPVE